MASSPRRFGLGSADSRRLIEGGATLKERLLLQAAIGESPPNGAGRQRTLAALGIAVGVSSVSGTAAASVLSRAVALGQAKWVVFGAIGAAIAVGGVELTKESDSIPPRAPVTASMGRKATAASSGAAPVENALSAVAPSSVSPLEPAPHPVPKNVGASSAVPSTTVREQPRTVPGVGLSPRSRSSAASAPAELVAQVAALDRARAALRGGRAGQSVALLDDFDRTYPGSRLGPEATVVRVRALLALGQRTQAMGLVRSYCRAGGRGAYGHRLMTLVGLNETACESSELDP